MFADTNGFLTTVVYLAVGKFKMNHEDVVWNVPLGFLLLMMREKIHIESDKHGIQLSTIEAIDDGEI